MDSFKFIKGKQKTAKPYWLSGFLMAGAVGFEPTTCGFGDRMKIENHSIHKTLKYRYI